MMLTEMKTWDSLSFSIRSPMCWKWVESTRLPGACEEWIHAERMQQAGVVWSHIGTALQVRQHSHC